MSHMTYIFVTGHIHVNEFYDMSLSFLNNEYILGAHLIYVTLFSSNIYMLAIYLFYVTQFAKNLDMLL